MVRCYKYRKIVLILIIMVQMILPVPAEANYDIKDYNDEFPQKVALLESLKLTVDSELDQPLTTQNAKEMNKVLNRGATIGNESQQGKELISYGEFIKMILDNCGYEGYVSYTGGYPDGYLKLASQKHLNKGINDKKPEETITVQQAYIMLYNALTINTIKTSIKSSVIEGKNTVKVISDDTLLKSVFGLEYITGIMTANTKTSIYDVTGTSKKIVVNGCEYTSDSRFDEYLGFEVKVYINDENEVVHVQPTKKNVTITATGDQILSKSTKKTVSLEAYGNDEKEITIRQGASYIYNDEYFTNTDTNLITDETFRSENYKYTFLDNNDDGDYDVVLVENYQYFKVSEVDKQNKYIYGRDENIISKQTNIFKSPQCLKLSEKSTIRYMDNVVVDIGIIKPGDILAIKIPMNATIETLDEDTEMDLILLDRKVSGLVSEMNDEEIFINGTPYRYNNEYVAVGDLVGKTLDFYVDLNGKLIICEENIKANTYAYIQKISQENGSNLEPVELRVFISGDKLVELEAALKVNIIDPDNRLTDGKTSGLGTLTGKQYVATNLQRMVGHIVKINIVNDKITKIELPRELTQGTAGKDGEFNYIPYDYDKYPNNYFNRKGVLGDQYQASSDIKTYNVPKNTDETEGYSTSIFSKSFPGTSAKGEIYNIDSAYNVGFVIAKKSGKYNDTITAAENIFVVKEISDAMYKDDKSVAVTGWYNGILQRYTFIDKDMPAITFDDAKTARKIYLDPNDPSKTREFTPKDLAIGDIIQISLKDGAIDGFRVFLDRSQEKSYQSNSFTKQITGSAKDAKQWEVTTYPFSTDDLYLAYGMLQGVGQNCFDLKVIDSGGDRTKTKVLRAFQPRITNVYVVDEAEKTVKKGDFSYIGHTDQNTDQNNDTFVDYYYGVERDVVIYK